MIAPHVDAVWQFQSQYKQRVSDYFRKHPDGTYDHFLDTWSRAHQVDRHIFDEVYFKLQKAGAIRLVEGGKAHGQLLADMEKEIERKIRAEKGLPAQTVTTAESPVATAPVNGSVQAPVTFPNAVLAAPSTTITKEPEMASTREWGIKELAPEERKLLDQTLQSRPEIGYEDLNEKLGFRLKRTVYYTTMHSIREGKYSFAGVNGGLHTSANRGTATPAPTVRSTVTPLNGSAVPFVNFTKISGIQIIGQIDTEGYTKEEIKTVRARLPTILAEILHKNMSFKVVQYTEDDDDEGQEKVTLEVRRIS